VSGLVNILPYCMGSRRPTCEARRRRNIVNLSRRRNKADREGSAEKEICETCTGATCEPRDIAAHVASHIGVEVFYRVACFALSDAPMKLEKSGCGKNGFDLNSGWNWQATKYG
jgi:hypothetical protein